MLDGNGTPFAASTVPPFTTSVEADGSYVANSCCCSMCKRMVINAGIEKVIVRDDDDHYRVISVKDWISDDESLEGSFGY